MSITYRYSHINDAMMRRTSCEILTVATFRLTKIIFIKGWKGGAKY